ncbi:hypothetical protein N656DRAFT_796769 [Canariomyces notabilis]|uniref:Uncharacterized protein n=1 Tax=Canariomyces notabilis TaxID=2074819 RepID=A0AAN6TH15_9PEZI|nr:hypothetical protein N656DRAFT_796769 [Canariomyces arenarius]
MARETSPPEKLIYWWAHFLCRKIQDRDVKLARPSITLEELAFRRLDRWGLPALTWMGNRLPASLWKDQDLAFVCQDDEEENQPLFVTEGNGAFLDEAAVVADRALAFFLAFGSASSSSSSLARLARSSPALTG